jgi:hypothetical protein
LVVNRAVAIPTDRRIAETVATVESTPIARGMPGGSGDDGHCRKKAQLRR